MNFVTFPVETTNIFPLANSHAGGQLLSEWNLRSRESVETDPNVEYFIGPSFTHSLADFEIHSQQDTYGTTISNSAIAISPGRALVNGHYIESLTQVVVDLNDANLIAAKENVSPLKGELAIGLKVAYSNYQTLAGSALIENDEDYYEGIQVVIVPTSSLRLPQDVPEENSWNKYNMDLLLGTFKYRNGAITAVKQNEHKIESIDAVRISDIESILGNIYVKRNRLDPNKLYVMSGKGSETKDTWCDSTDSLVVWDNTPTIGKNLPSNQSRFEYNSATETTSLVLAHKQVDGMTNTAGDSVYYQDKVYNLPEASFDAETGGVITPKYTKKIKEIKDKVDLFYRLPNGRMRQYIDVLSDRNDLPTIPVSEDVRWPYSRNERDLSVSNLRSSLDSLRVEVNNLKNSLEDKIKASVLDNASTYFNENIDSKLTAINSSIDTLNTNIENLDTRVTKLEEGSSGSETDIKALKARVDALERSVNSINQSIAGLTSTITAEITAAKKSLESSINDKYSESLSQLLDEFAKLQADFTTQFNQSRQELERMIESLVRTTLDETQIFTKWTWSPGDYVLVGQDLTVNATVEGRAPSSMYIVGPGTVSSIEYVDTLVENISTAASSSTNYKRNYETMLRKVPTSLAGGVELGAAEITSLDQAGDTDPGLWVLSAYKGKPFTDYFVARMKTINNETNTETWTCVYYTPNVVDTRYSYLDPVWVTGGVPLATETTVGGFVNVPETAIGGGYVYRDDNGYLKLLDYDLLLTGVLAYQLGEDRSEGSGLSLVEIQAILEDEVNDRVVFPNETQKARCEESGEDPNIIHLYLDLSEDAGTLVIHDIASRYGSSLYVHISGTATDETTILFKNIDKLRIDGNIGGAPNIILQNVSLYYDPNVLEASSLITGLSLWYEQYESTDSNIQVDGMTVTLLGRIESSETFDPWDETYNNDNHYAYALRSLTYGDDGSIINVGMLVSDSTTANIDDGMSAFVSTFTLPQGVGLGYPASRMTHRIKITGSFVSHYPLDDGTWMMKQTEFSAITQKYSPLLRKNEVAGTISFLTNSFVLDEIHGVTPDTTVDGWDLNTPHYFTGGVVE